MKPMFALGMLLAFTALTFPGTSAQASCPVDTTPDFTDNCYHEYILYNVDAAEVDILILPSASPYALRDSIILEESVQMWDDGINAMGPSWLANGLNLHWYSVGLDEIPESALWDPEIIIVPAEVNYALLLGIGLQVPAQICHHQPPPGIMSLNMELAALPDFHQHPNSVWGSLTVACDNGGYQCIVVNTNFLNTPTADNRRDMFDLNSHELGHCLGIGHVGDAGDFTANAYPEDDIMSYEQDGHDPGHVLCVSTLNILALERVYGDLLGQSGYPVYPYRSYVHMAPADWDDDNCDEPTASYTDVTPVTESDTLTGIPTDLATCALDAIVDNLLINWVNPLLACA